MSLLRYSIPILSASALIIAVGCWSTPNERATKGSNDRNDAPDISSVELTKRSDPVSKLMFTELSVNETGIDFANELKPEHMKKYLLNGAGLCTGDYDNDGLVDVYLISQDGPNKLFRQVKPWKFEDVTQSAGGLAGGDDSGTGATFADVNGDGFLDLYVCNIDGPNLLFMNQGDGSFQEQGAAWKVDFSGPTTMAAFADYDNDGDLDLYLLNNRILALADETAKIKVRMVDGRPTVHPDQRHQYFFLEGRMQEAGQHDQLLRNDDGHFVNFTAEAGIVGYDMGLSATWWDYDDDGWVDLYIGNDMKSPDHLYRNLGNGKFEDVLADAVGHTPWFSMGADASDINNDGLLDFLIADMSSTTHYKQKTTMGEMGSSAWFLTLGKPRQFMRNALYLNSGTSRFWEAANLAGLDSSDWTWSVKIADQDCDGKVDVFFTNGVGKNITDSDLKNEFAKLMAEGKKDEAESQILRIPPLKERNLFFRNQGDLRFTNVADDWGADHFGVSNGCSVVDIDRDGDLDLLVSHMNEPLGVYRNDCTVGNRLLVKLNGTLSNRNGIHARVIVETESGRQIRQINLTRGYMSADEPLAHFGLGDDERIAKLTVKWPSGIVQQFEGLQANRFYTITEKGASEPDRLAAKMTPPIFKEVAREVGIDFKHVETPVDDYRFQPLLPNKLSQLGPGVAWADVNGDGFQDCFLGNGAGSSGCLFVGSENGKFAEFPGPWKELQAHEDMAPQFLDFDSDGDQDLIVVSGGYEQDAESELLRNRLFVNDGNGNFSVASESTIPDQRNASSCACSCDYDRDGDLDMFVGTRVLPRRWPLPATSCIWENQNGRFVDVTDKVAPGLTSIGLVTSAIWSDADQDGWVDLWVTLEWGNIKFFRNHQGKLVDQTEQAGLSKDLGWWNSIAAGDIDSDGDTDYVVMNTGLNTKYHATHEYPVQLFAGDFDNTGNINLVESEWEGEKCYPIRGKSCSSQAMPQLAEKFETYHEFALAELVDIYTENALENAAKFVANRLDSVLLLNNGVGQFQIKTLPRLAQVSPGFGVAVEDIDLDGFADICIAQNFLHPQPETGQMDGGMGLVLKGAGNGEFESMPPTQSGLIVTGQGMGLAIVDINRDARPDLVVAVNDDKATVFVNQSKSDRRTFVVQVDGGNGNLTGIGSRIVLKSKSGKICTREIYSASGYLSQSSGELFFSLAKDDSIESLEIQWPDGSTESRIVNDADQRIVIKKAIE